MKYHISHDMQIFDKAFSSENTKTTHLAVALQTKITPGKNRECLLSTQYAEIHVCAYPGNTA